MKFIFLTMCLIIVCTVCTTAPAAFVSAGIDADASLLTEAQEVIMEGKQAPESAPPDVPDGSLQLQTAASEAAYEATNAPTLNAKDSQLETLPTPEPTPEPVTIKIQLAGDVLLHKTPVKSANIGGDTYDFRPYFEHIKPYIDGDLAVCNMESPVDAYGDNSGISSYPLFNVPFEIIDALKDTGFDHLITANNHAFDHGLSGVSSTLAHIQRAGLTSTGTYIDEETFNTPTIIDVNGISVGIIAYTDSYNGRQTAVPADMLPYMMRSFKSYYNLDDVPTMIEDIDALRAAGAELVIVSVHWGEEYEDKPRPNRRAIAEALCDGGADIIMGHHPHCVQPIEWYTATRSSSGGSSSGSGENTKRCLIIYSLGNFFADQIALSTPQPKTQYGMLVDVYITKTPEESIQIDTYSVLPTLSYRGAPAGSARYRVMPLDNIHGPEKPDIMPDRAAWDWGKRAYAHVAAIVGLE